MALILPNYYPGRFNAPTAAYPHGSHKNRSTATSNDGSYYEQAWANDIQGFHSQLLSAAGITPSGVPDKVGASDLYNALKGLFLMRGNNLSDVASVSQTLANLGLGEGSALPVGVPVPWPSATPPTGWLKCNGAPFSAAQYPKLALAYPSLALPDLRGEFIRGWDDGRGIDAGRGILSAQGDAIRNIVGHISCVRRGAGFSDLNDGAFRYDSNWSTKIQGQGEDDNWGSVVSFDPSRVVPTAPENRPRSIAFNFIVRAA